MIEICFDEGVRCAAEWAQLVVPEPRVSERDWYDLGNLVIQFAVAVGTTGATYYAYKATRFQTGPTLALRASTVQKAEFRHTPDGSLICQTMPSLQLRIDNIGAREVTLSALEFTILGFPKIAAEYVGNIFGADKEHFFFPKTLACEGNCVFTLSTVALCFNLQIMSDGWSAIARRMRCKSLLGLLRLRVRLSTGHTFQVSLPSSLHDLAWQALQRRKKGYLDWAE